MQLGGVLEKGQGVFAQVQVAAQKEALVVVGVEEEVLGRRTEVAVVVLEQEVADRYVVGTAVTVHSTVATVRRS